MSHINFVSISPQSRGLMAPAASVRVLGGQVMQPGLAKLLLPPLLYEATPQVLQFCPP